eukprot:m.1529164 g.1529164  ORF g.1529164 m.1529164 type:complete len:69 (+) comp25238_c1_seq33:5153-5359(+)
MMRPKYGLESSTKTRVAAARHARVWQSGRNPRASRPGLSKVLSNSDAGACLDDTVPVHNGHGFAEFQW